MSRELIQNETQIDVKLGAASGSEPMCLRSLLHESQSTETGSTDEAVLADQLDRAVGFEQHSADGSWIRLDCGRYACRATCTISGSAVSARIHGSNLQADCIEYQD